MKKSKDIMTPETPTPIIDITETGTSEIETFIDPSYIKTAETTDSAPINEATPGNISVGASRGLFYIPNTSTVRETRRALAGGHNPQSMINTASAASKTRASHTYNNEQGIISYTSKTRSAETIVKCAEKAASMILSGKTSDAAKTLGYTLKEYTRQTHTTNGILSPNYIEFYANDALNDGVGSSLDAVRRTFNNGYKLLAGISAVEIKRYRKNGQITEDDYDITPHLLFTKIEIRGGRYRVYFDPQNAPKMFNEYYTAVPDFTFKLKFRPYMLMLMIADYARRYSSNESFNIGMRFVQSYLGLPDEKDNDSPRKTIIEPIEKAIEEIESFVGSSGDIQITPTPVDILTRDRIKMADFLNGYLEIKLSGYYRHFFSKIDTAKPSRSRRARPAAKQ